MIEIIFEKQNDNSDGRIYADKVNNPNVTVGFFGDIVIAGNTEANEYDDDLFDFIINNVIDERKERMLLVTSPKWKQKLWRLLPDQIKYYRVSFGHELNGEKFRKNNLKWRDRIPPGYKIAERDFVSDEFIKNYGEDLNFSANPKKFSVVLIDDADKVVSECYTVDIDEAGHINTGVDTYKDKYRRKGFAYLTAAAFIEICLEKNYKPGWHCHNIDVGSKRLADRLGFEESGRVSWFAV
jgi:RimJ/RimL family protein N-acetyltransferase